MSFHSLMDENLFNWKSFKLSIRPPRTLLVARTNKFSFARETQTITHFLFFFALFVVIIFLYYYIQLDKFSREVGDS